MKSFLNRLILSDSKKKLLQYAENVAVTKAVAEDVAVMLLIRYCGKIMKSFLNRLILSDSEKKLYPK